MFKHLKFSLYIYHWYTIPFNTLYHVFFGVNMYHRVTHYTFLLWLVDVNGSEHYLLRFIDLYYIGFVWFENEINNFVSLKLDKCTYTLEIMCILALLE